MTNSTISVERVNIELTEEKLPLFIIFAELLGYVSPFLEWAEKYCKGENIERFMVNVLKEESLAIFREMQKDYSLEDIHDWWDAFHYVAIEEYENSLSNKQDDLPF